MEFDQRAGSQPPPQETMVELQIEEETEERAHRMRMEQLEAESNAHGLQLEILEKRKEQLPPMGTIPSQQQGEGESLPVSLTALRNSYPPLRDYVIAIRFLGINGCQSSYPNWLEKPGKSLMKWRWMML